MVTNWLNDTISSHVKIWLISSHVKTSMISLLSSLSLNLYLNLLVYHRNIFGSSSKVYGNLRKFSKILRICSGTLVWSLEQFWKIFGNLRKVVGNLRKIIKKAVITNFYIIKRTLHVSSKIWISCSRGKNNISLVRCVHSWDIVLATPT